MSNLPHTALTTGNRLAVLQWLTHGYWIDTDHLIHGPNVRTELVQPESSVQPFIVPYQAILHSNAGPAASFWSNLINFWRRADVTGEAHFQVHGVSLPATLVQAIPLNRRADCNYKANRFYVRGQWVGAISFETQDRGGASLPVTPWSVGNHAVAPEVWGQWDTMVSALTAISVCYGLWCTQPAYWNDAGIGHHSLFAEWSIYIGKTCPGAARIRQMDSIRKAVADNLVAFSNETGWKCGDGKP